MDMSGEEVRSLIEEEGNTSMEESKEGGSQLDMSDGEEVRSLVEENEQCILLFGLVVQQPKACVTKKKVRCRNTEQV